MSQVGLVANTQDPAGTLQIQFYTINTKVVEQATSLNAMKAKIDELKADLLIRQAQYDQFTGYLISKGVTDLTLPLTLDQQAAIAADGFVTS